TVESDTAGRCGEQPHDVAARVSVDLQSHTGRGTAWRVTECKRALAAVVPESQHRGARRIPVERQASGRRCTAVAVHRAAHVQRRDPAGAYVQREAIEGSSGANGDGSLEMSGRVPEINPVPLWEVDLPVARTHLPYGRGEQVVPEQKLVPHVGDRGI